MSKFARSSKNCEKYIGEIAIFAKHLLEEVEGCLSKTAISAISAISPKIGEIAVFVKINYAKC